MITKAGLKTIDMCHNEMVVQFQAQAGDKITYPTDKWSEYVSRCLFVTVDLQRFP